MKRASRRFIKHLAVERNLSTYTVKGYKSDIKKFDELICRKFGKDLLPGDITKRMVQEFLKHLADHGYRKRNGPASRTRRLTALSSFFKFLYREGLLRNNPTAELSVPRKATDEPVFLTEDEYQRLFNAADGFGNPFLEEREMVNQPLPGSIGENLNTNNSIVKKYAQGGQNYITTGGQ